MSIKDYVSVIFVKIAEVKVTISLWACQITDLGQIRYTRSARNAVEQRRFSQQSELEKPYFLVGVNQISFRLLS